MEAEVEIENSVKRFHKTLYVGEFELGKFQF